MESMRTNERPRGMCTARRSLLTRTAALCALLFGCAYAAPPQAAGDAAAMGHEESSSCGRRGRWGGFSHLDVTQRPGVLIERGIGSRVDVLGARFPLSSQETTTLSFEFFTYSERALLFHAESDDGRHELTAWVDRGALKVRLVGWCLWLMHDETLRHRGNVTDGTVHTITLVGRKADGVRVRVDGQYDIFFLHTSRVLSCWHVNNFYFGGPGPKRQQHEGNGNSEYSFKMMGCVRQLTLDQDDAHDGAVFSYRRTSTCPYLPTKSAYAALSGL